MAALTADVGIRAATVAGVCRYAGMSRRTFYDVFADLGDCLEAAVARAFAELLEAVEEAAATAPPGELWEARAVRIVTALVTAFERDVPLARLCLGEARAGGRALDEVRRDAIGRMATILAGDRPCDEAVARGAVAAVLELAESRSSETPQRGFGELVATAIYLAMVPFTGRRTALEWSERALVAPAPEPDRAPPPRAATGGSGPTVTDLTRRTLLHLEGTPDASNASVAQAVGVAHPSQISRHLARLEREGIAQRERRGRTNAWRLPTACHRAPRQLR